MKNIALFAAFMATLTTGFAAVAVGTNSEGFLTGNVSLRHSDNIFLSEVNETSSTIFTVAPGVAVEFGTDALTTNTFAFSEEFVWYSESSNLNNELAHANYDGTFEGAASRISFGAGYNQYAQNTRNAALAAAISENSILDADLLFEWDLSALTSIDAGLTYEDNNYKSAAFRDKQTLSLPINFYYEVAPLLDFSVGYRYRSVDQSGAANSDSHFFNVGFRGDFTPKLTGTVRAGYVSRDIDAFGALPSKSNSSFGLQGALDYAYSDKTAFNISAGNDYGNAAIGSTYELLTIGGGVTSDITEVFALDARVDYNRFTYKQSPREDKYWTFDLGGNFRLNEYADLRVSYAHQDNNSNQGGADFKSNVFGVSAAFRY